jgi:hypothetical protein
MQHLLNDSKCMTGATLTNSWTELDADRHADSLIAGGFCRLSAPIAAVKSFETMVVEYATISPDIKHSFSFPHDTDGFLPFGMERSRTTQSVDLCERFCYRHALQERRRAARFTQCEFYAAVIAAEQVLWELADDLLRGIARKLGRWESPEIRCSSYLQFCAYQSQYWQADRDFLQDRHEDGNLLTLVMATRDGLVLYPDGTTCEIPAIPGEIVVFTGSLLTVLTNGQIAAMDHAVLNAPLPQTRSSLVFFALPNMAKLHPRLVDGEPVDLEPLANELHQSFGNHAFLSDSYGIG